MPGKRLKQTSGRHTVGLGRASIIRGRRVVAGVLALSHFPSLHLPVPLSISLSFANPGLDTTVLHYQVVDDTRGFEGPRRRDRSRGGKRHGANGVRSTRFAAPSRISSLIASPVTGALSIPQTLWPVAT
jgi:hypothetical protein